MDSSRSKGDLILKSKGFSPIETAPKRIARIAEEKARALGYKTDSMNKYVKKDENGWTVYFLPKTPIFGGDVQILINRKGKVTAVKRGA